MTRRVQVLMWTGVAAAPLAWMAEHGFGFGVSQANCNVVGPEWGVSFSTWIWVVTAVTALIAVGGLLASILAYRAVRSADTDDPPPTGRVWLLAVFGMITNPLLLVMILLSGIGALLLDSCTRA